jgi:hypothetical protein
MKTTSNHWPAKAALFALAGAVIGSLTTASAAVVTYSQGDLLVGFRASGGTGADTTFVYNIGSSTGFRDNGNQGLASIGNQLAATYGSDWYTRSDVSWGVIGVRSNANPQFDATVVNGDPVSTVYASKSSTGFGTSTAWGAGTAFVRSQVVLAANDVAGFAHIGSEVAGTFAFQQEAAGTNGRGAFVATSAENDWANYTSGSTDFTIFTGGIEGTFGTGTGFAYLDVYRILSTTAGANPTGILGRGSYETTIYIDATGQLFAGTSAIPEPSTYAAFFGVAALTLAGFRRRHASRKA